MGQKIIGLKLGLGSIRVVTLQQGLWGLEGGECRSIEIKTGVSAEEGIREGLQNLIGSGVLKGETVIVSLPGDEVMTRVISLPFHDPKKIAQVVPYEVEGFLPMNVEDLVIDHQILNRREGTSEVLVAAVPKTTVERYLQWLREVGIEPKIIELESMALFNIARFFGVFNENGNLLIDMGRRRSSLCIVKNGVLKMVRTVLFGEEQLESILTEKEGMDIHEARGYLHRLGLKKQEDTQNTHLEKIFPLLRDVLDSFVKEIMTTLQFNHLQGEEVISHLFICGEGSHIPEVSQYLAQALEMSLIPINDLGRISSKRTLSLKKRENILEFLPHDEKGLYLPVLGLALKEVISDEGSWINFRKGEFVYGKETQALRRRIFILGGLVFIILSSGLLDLYIHFHMKDSRHQSLKEDLSQTYMAMFPGAKNVVDEVQQTRSALEEMKKKITKIGTGQVTPLQILAELTSRIPEEADIEVYDLSIDQSKVRMEAEAASFDSIDSIKRSFLKVKEVKEVVVSDARVSAEKDRVKFRVTLEWREGI